jgi:hypothetical protein
MIRETLAEALGVMLIISGLANGIRYRWSALKIKEAGIARGHSRKSMNTAIIDDTIKLLYGIARFDLYLISSAVAALIFMTYKWIIIYLYYPYRYRGLANFKKPNLSKYILNSLIPNKYRRRL